MEKRKGKYDGPEDINTSVFFSPPRNLEETGKLIVVTITTLVRFQFSLKNSGMFLILSLCKNELESLGKRREN